MKKCELVLLIDDNDFDNFVNKKMLEKMDFASELKIQKNGAEGISYLKTLIKLGKAPNFIFLDLDMPIMNGFDFLKQYQTLPKVPDNDTKIFVLSSSSNPTDFETAMALGCNAYFEKPLTKEKIQEIYRTVFH